MTLLTELADKLALVSDGYARKCDIKRDNDWYALKIAEEAGELVAEHLRLSGRGRRRDRSDEDIRQALSDETADLLALTLLFARHNGIDLDSALQRKWFKYLDNGSKAQ